tara:strand:+ start:1038 stop:1226 length:189 start_codon:yes stop_codon:yes gene_type:complete
MSKDKDLDMQKHTLNLRRGDYALMHDLFPDLGGGPAIRQLIASFIDKHYAVIKPATKEPLND